MTAAIATPIDVVGEPRRLRDAGRQDRLDEMTFELPLAGGDAPTGKVTPAAIAAVRAAHLADDGRLVGYPERLREEVPPQSLRGYLSGAIDLITRTPDERFVVLDYKTNRLDKYGPAALDAEIQRSHYALQAALYLVATHRYLPLAPPGVRAAEAPRRRALPLPPRDGRHGRQRGLRLASACCACHRPERPPRAR